MQAAPPGPRMSSSESSASFEDDRLRIRPYNFHQPVLEAILLHCTPETSQVLQRLFLGSNSVGPRILLCCSELEWGSGKPPNLPAVNVIFDAIKLSEKPE